MSFPSLFLLLITSHPKSSQVPHPSPLESPYLSVALLSYPTGCLGGWLEVSVCPRLHAHRISNPYVQGYSTNA